MPRELFAPRPLLIFGSSVLRHYLSLAQVHAALAYYHANQDGMDAQMEADEAECDRLEQVHRESGNHA